MNQVAAKVLLIEDNPGDVKLVQVLLESSDEHQQPFELIRVGQLSDAFPLLAKGGIMAILLDLGLPDGNGIDTLIRVHAAAPMIPIVVLSAEEDEMLAIRSVQLGAQDFLVKHGISGMLLRRAICYAMERKRLMEQLQYLAHYDVLTGLANRKLFYDRLKHDVLGAKRSKKSLALIFLDLNDFKQVNDSLGHHVGDELLKNVAKRLSGSVRASDCVARMGGDEFTIILNGLNNAEEAALIADKILKALIEPFKFGDSMMVIRASLGIATYPDDSDELDKLIGAADSAMYKAKESGSEKISRFCFYSAAMTAKVQHEVKKIHQLKQALENGEFELYYQPEVDVHSGKIIGMEALLRWRHPDQGVLTPNSFMQDLEDTGLIVPVGEWVIRKACEQCKVWQDQSFPTLTVSINISAKQFRHNGFADGVLDAIDQLNVNPALIELGFNEETLWEEEERSVIVLDRLSQAGVKLSLDHFGSGSISFKTLTRFPIHVIKIDHALIAKASLDSAETAIAKAAIEIAHVFNIKGLAGCIETQDQLEWARRIACDEVQGHLYSKPLPVAEATELIARHDFLSPQD